MNFKTRYIGGPNFEMIELTVEGSNSSITEDITSMKGLVDENFIINLRDIADELEEHNQKVK